MSKPRLNSHAYLLPLLSATINDAADEQTAREAATRILKDSELPRDEIDFARTHIDLVCHNKFNGAHQRPRT